MEFTPEELKQLRRDAASQPPLLRIGKNGASSGVIGEIKRQLENRGSVKLKLLKAVTETADRHAVAETLASVGGIVLLAKKPGREHPVVANHRGSRFKGGAK